jgi:hypothetical protein
MKMGAIVAETSEENADLILWVWLNLGLAFQLQDDYLDALVILWKASRRWYYWKKKNVFIFKSDRIFSAKGVSIITFIFDATWR